MKKSITPFQKDALDFSSNIILTANAGSGKTFVLSKRFVEILLKENVEIENIVAITFTDKAAGELNKKIAGEIEERIKETSNLKELNKLENARRQLVSANISTIHSFCISILKEFSPEAGIDANFIPVDQSTSDELILLSIDESLNHLISNTDYSEALKYLIRFFGSKISLIENMQYGIEQRKIIEQNARTLYDKPADEFVVMLNSLFERYYDHFFGSSIPKVLDSISAINSHVLKLKPENQIALEVLSKLKTLVNTERRDELFDGLKELQNLILTQKNEIKNRGYLSKNREQYFSEINEVESLFSRIGQILNSDFSEKALLEYYHFGKNYLKVYDYVLKLYSDKKSEKGYLDFEDILLLTQKIINMEEVKDYLRLRYKFIMIDEYQDTNDIQYRIFMPILDNLRQGNLFVVGDEKQSIYMFRDADLAVFNKTKDDIAELNEKGKLLLLPHSFRMTPELVLFTNKLFSQLFSNADPILNEVGYNELIYAKEEIEEGEVNFLIAREPDPFTEAELVASKILEIVSSGLIKLNEIGILCRKRSMFQVLEEAFVSKNIPYTVLGGKGFYQKQSISDLYNYLNFLVNPDDDAALVGILRSPFYNFSDPKLFEISLMEGKNFFEKLKSYSLKDDQSKNTVLSLNSHLDLSVSSGIFTLIRRILTDRGYWSVVSAKRNSTQELANLNKLISIARDFHSKSFNNLYDFTLYLRDAIDSMQDEGQAQIAKDSDTVKLLTIHQSKGLEYKAVFIYGCNDYSKENLIRSRSMGIDKEFGFPVKVFMNGSYFAGAVTPAVVSLYNYIHQQKNNAELKRLLYVAVTRAMNYLYISSTLNKYPSGGSFLEMFREGLNINFEMSPLFLSGDVVFMIKNNESFTFQKTKISTEIKIASEFKELPPLKSGETESTGKKMLLQTITDRPKQEIISATKISMFTQCPVKYELTYELGYPTVFNMVKKYSANEFEFNSKEDEELKQYAEIKGRIIHSLLSENVERADIEVVMEKFIASESINHPEQVLKLRNSVSETLNRYYDSETFKTIQSYTEFRNEFEIYTEEGDNFLYGIVDRLIIEKERLLIIDYKTDDIEKEMIESRAADYYQQLKFYAYILSKFFSGQNYFDLQLVFLKHPDQTLLKRIDRKDLMKYRNGLLNSIEDIQDKNYKPNLDHCRKCHFFFEGNKCVKSIASGDNQEW